MYLNERVQACYQYVSTRALWILLKRFVIEQEVRIKLQKQIEEKEKLLRQLQEQALLQHKIAEVNRQAGRSSVQPLTPQQQAHLKRKIQTDSLRKEGIFITPKIVWEKFHHTRPGNLGNRELPREIVCIHLNCYSGTSCVQIHLSFISVICFCLPLRFLFHSVSTS